MLDGRPRIDHLRHALDAWLADQPPTAQYTLLAVRHASDLEERVPYPATARQVSAAANDMKPWGATHLAASIEAAAQAASSIAKSNGEPYATLLVVTDGDDIAALFPPRIPVLPDNVVFDSISLPSTSPATSAHLLDALEARYGSARVVPIPVRPERASPEPAESSESDTVSHGLLVRWAQFARWAFAGFVMLGLAAVAKAASTHRRRVRRVAEHNARPPLLRLEIRGPTGRTNTRIDRYPATIGPGFGPFDHPDCEAPPVRVTFSVIDGSVVLSSDEPVKVNGIGRNRHTVGDRDQIRIGRVRLIVAEVSRPKPMRPPRPRHRRYPIAPAAAAIAATVAFTIAPPQLPAVRSIDQPGTQHVETADIEPIPDSREVTAVSTDPLPVLRLPAVIGPTDPLPDVTLDYIAFHAHPDDEALDYGALLSRLHHAGLTGAVVLMTDGESGRDQHPWREVTTTYPDHRLTGSRLARVRIGEAREAIGWLGASYYVRIGLPNHPYNTIRDELTAFQVIDRWGGRAALVGRVAGIIEHFRPRIVISPPEPGPAYEHFEHQATGIIVSEAVDRLASSGSTPVQAHIIAIDSRQPDGYEDLIAVSPWVPSLDGSIPRLRQLLALQAHRTQRDATVIGVETRLTLPYDYFMLRASNQSMIAELLGEALVTDLPQNR